MFQTTLITTALEWERILKIEDEKRMNDRFEDVFTEETGRVIVASEKKESTMTRLAKEQQEKPCGGYSQKPCNEIPAR